MRVLHAAGDTPMAQAAQLHAAAGRARSCCEAHARADVANIRLGPGDDQRYPSAEETEAAVRRLMERSRLMVRGKFTVVQVSQVNWSKDARIVKLQAVYDQTTEENQKYSKATPSGTIEMTVDNPPASAQLELGKTFYVDFTPAE